MEKFKIAWKAQFLYPLVCADQIWAKNIEPKYSPEKKRVGGAQRAAPPLMIAYDPLSLKKQYTVPRKG